MAETRTAIKIAYEQTGHETVAKTLSDLINQASRLQTILANLNYSGNVSGVPPSAGGGTMGGSSLNSSLPMARIAPGGHTSSVVTGGSSTQSGGNQSVSNVINRNVVNSYSLSGLDPNRGRLQPQSAVPLQNPALEATNHLIQEQRAVSARAANFGMQGGGSGASIPLMASEYGSANLLISEQRARRNRSANFGYAARIRNTSFDNTLFSDGLEGTLLGGGGSLYTGVRHTESGLTREGERAMQAERPLNMRDRMGGLLKGRSSYAMMISAGLVAHGVTSRYADYWSSMYSAAPVETAGMYSGNYFQMLQSQREAEAIRQSAKMRASYAPAQIGSTGLMGLAPMLMLGIANPLIGIAAAGAAMGGGMGLNMWSSKSQSEKQSKIDTQTAQLLAGMQTAQARFTTSTNAANVTAGLIPFGLDNQKTLDTLIYRGKEAGYGAADTLGLISRFAQAGGNINNRLAEKIPDQLRFNNIRPESIGMLSKAFLPGGGIDPASIYRDPLNWTPEEIMFHRTRAYANSAGIEASRINEWMQRSAAFNTRYAERGLTVSANAQTEIMRRYGNPKLKGMSQVAFTENIQQFGMGVADELSESMMPKRLAQALMLQRAIAHGKNPAEWYRNLSNPVMAAAMGADIESKLPDMLRPFFAAQVTGMVPHAATFRGGGVVPTTPAPVPNANEPSENKVANDVIEVLKTVAESNNAYLQKWMTTIDMADKQLDVIQKAIRNSVGSIPVAQ
jgi:hypothetical protein